MAIVTSHIREMLSQAIDACEKAEEASESYFGKRMESVDDEAAAIQRLLEGAAINAQHAAAEIQDERFRFLYGSHGYTKEGWT